jgi:phosphate acetyltransferase
MAGIHGIERWQRLLERCRSIEPLHVAVVHPCDRPSLESTLAAAEAGLIDPVLIAPQSRLERLAAEFQLSLDGHERIDVPHSHAAAAKAAELARSGRVDALLKGSLHTDELMPSVIDERAGLRTERRMSHCFVMDVPGRADPLIITDGAVNIAPGLAEKRDIVQNAIDLASALGFSPVRVAIMSATESVNPKIPSTIDAAALCKMADRGQIRGALLDGPLALDNAISEEAVRLKGIDSQVAGRANVLVAPDLEAGNLLAKSLSFLANAESAGIVLGARVPVILNSRADSVAARISSCAIGAIFSEWLGQRTLAAARAAV